MALARCYQCLGQRQWKTKEMLYLSTGRAGMSNIFGNIYKDSHVFLPEAKVKLRFIYKDLTATLKVKSSTSRESAVPRSGY